MHCSELLHSCQVQMTAFSRITEPHLSFVRNLVAVIDIKYYCSCINALLHPMDSPGAEWGNFMYFMYQLFAVMCALHLKGKKHGAAFKTTFEKLKVRYMQA
jgi:hypothetical protein